jgi:hypothetical protein
VLKAQCINSHTDIHKVCCPFLPSFSGSSCLMAPGPPGPPGLAPGLSAPAGLNTPLIPPNFNFNAPVIHFGQTLSGATTISTPQPSAVPVMPVARPIVFREAEGPRLAPSTEDQLHTVFVGGVPEDLSDEWMERITRVRSFASLSFFLYTYD